MAAFVALLIMPLVVAAVLLLVRRRGSGLPARPRAWWLILVVVGFDVAADMVRGQDETLWGVTNRIEGAAKLAALCLFLALNLRLQLRQATAVAVLLIAVGGGMNALASLAFGGMPVSASAAASTGQAFGQSERPHSEYVAADARGPIAVALGDSIPVPLLEKAVSVGDIGLFVGLPLLLYSVLDSLLTKRVIQTHSQAMGPQTQQSLITAREEDT